MYVYVLNISTAFFFHIDNYGSRDRGPHVLPHRLLMILDILIFLRSE